MLRNFPVRWHRGGVYIPLKLFHPNIRTHLAINAKTSRIFCPVYNYKQPVNQGFLRSFNRYFTDPSVFSATTKSSPLSFQIHLPLSLDKGTVALGKLAFKE